MSKTRIQVYTDPLLKRRIELAAARRDMPVTEYCLEAIAQRLAEEELLNADEVTIQVEPGWHDQFTHHFKQLHEIILTEGAGVTIDVDQLIDDTRAEREEDILDLR